MISITYRCGHKGTLTTSHGEDGGGAMRAPVPCPDCEPAPHVMAPDIFGEVHDMGASESQLNGWIAPAAPVRHERTVCICGHGPQFHRPSYCERCSTGGRRKASGSWHAYQRVSTLPLLGGPLL